MQTIPQHMDLFGFFLCCALLWLYRTFSQIHAMYLPYSYGFIVNVGYTNGIFPTFSSQTWPILHKNHCQCCYSFMQIYINSQVNKFGNCTNTDQGYILNLTMYGLYVLVIKTRTYALSLLSPCFRKASFHVLCVALAMGSGCSCLRVSFFVSLRPGRNEKSFTVVWSEWRFT